MNEELKTKEYMDKLGQIKLSESSRARMENELLEYAKFHNVRVGEVGRSSSVPSGTSLFRYKFTTMPIAILIAIFISAGTSFAAQGSTPGDMLYPIKTNINENIASSLAIGADAQARFEANVLEERLEEAEELKTEGRLTGDLAVSVSDRIATQANATLSAAAKSNSTVKNETTTRTQLALQKFIKLVGDDSALAAKVKTQLTATVLATGEIDVELLRSDVSTRLNTLRNVVGEAKADLETNVEARFNAKLDSALNLTTDVANKTEAEVRASLNDAATLIGEVEAELSTLGQVEVNDNGMIIDVDFSVDPMESPRDDESTSGQVDADTKVNAGTDVQIDSDPIDLKVDADTSVKASSGLSL